MPTENLLESYRIDSLLDTGHSSTRQLVENDRHQVSMSIAINNVFNHLVSIIRAKHRNMIVFSVG